MNRQEKIDSLYAAFDEILHPKNGNVSMMGAHWHPKFMGLERNDCPVPNIKQYIKRLSDYAKIRRWDD